MDKPDMSSMDRTQKNIAKIKALFPDAVTEVIKDGKVQYAIDFDILKADLGDEIVEGNTERYQFTWPDKAQAKLLADRKITKTLRPCREESVDFDNTQNLYIEGDNLDVLKLLQETYLGKIKMIYIDPPYNTGNDFIYNDSFKIDKQGYSAISGDFDDEGNRLVTNLESNGRFHTDWLNMIYPRLKVARDLLSDDGVIFISIDDNEVENLKKICNEIFGEINYVATFPWRKRTAKSDVPFGVSQDYEWIVCYAKTGMFKASVQGKERRYFETPDFPGRPWRFHDMTTQRSASERPNSYFTMINPKNGAEYPADPNRTWRITVDTFQKYYDANEIIFPGDYDFLNISKPVARYFKDNDIEKDGEDFGRVPLSTKLPEDVGMSQDGTKEMKSIFGSILFPFPKASKLIKYLISAVSKSNDIILDFFSGSATTAHAVMQLNAEDGGNRKYIMVQLPEKCNEQSEAFKAGYKNICEIGKERIRRAGEKLADENRLLAPNLDIGFRVLKLDSSNMKNTYYNAEEITQSLFDEITDNIKEDRTPEDLLFQVMLDMGVNLSAKIKTKTIADKKVFLVNETALIACFDNKLNEQVITEIAKMKPVYAVFRDSGFESDSVAANFDQIFDTYSFNTVRIVL